MKKLGFADKCVGLVMACVKSISYSVPEELSLPEGSYKVIIFLHISSIMCGRFELFNPQSGRK